jgi:large subunit ribosomal protein L24
MLKIRKNDEVVVMRGKDAGSKGRILEVDVKTKRAIVEGLNLVKKHQKRSAKNLKAGITEKAALIPMCALALASKKDGKPVRVHIEVRESDGKTRKVRVAARTGEVFD